MFEVLLTHKLVVHTETAGVLEGFMQVGRAHELTVRIVMAAIGHTIFHGPVRMRRLEVVDNHRLLRAHLVAIDIYTLADEDSDCVLVADLDLWVLHLYAVVTTPKVVQLPMAEPFFTGLSVPLVGSF